MTSTMPPHVRSNRAREHREQFDGRRHLPFDDVERARCPYPLYESTPAPITSSPLVRLETYTCTAFDMTTVGWIGSSNSGDERLQRWDYRHRNPEPVGEAWRCPAAHNATRPAPMRPREVSTAVTRPPSVAKPVTSQFWIMSMPALTALRRNPMPT